MIWIKKYNKTASFKESDNIREKEKKLIKLKKKFSIKDENDILHIALIR